MFKHCHKIKIQGRTSKQKVLNGHELLFKLRFRDIG